MTIETMWVGLVAGYPTFFDIAGPNRIAVHVCVKNDKVQDIQVLPPIDLSPVLKNKT